METSQQSTEGSTESADSEINTWLSKTCGLRGINNIDIFNLLRGSRHLFRADGLHPSRSGVKVQMEHFWFSLRRASARPKMLHPDRQQSRPHKGKTSPPLNVSVPTTSSWISLLIPSSIHSPPPRSFWDSLIEWKCWLMVALNSAHGHSHVACLHPKHARSVTPTPAIAKMTKRESSSLLDALTRLIRQGHCLTNSTMNKMHSTDSENVPNIEYWQFWTVLDNSEKVGYILHLMLH